MIGAGLSAVFQMQNEMALQARDLSRVREGGFKGERTVGRERGCAE